MAPKVDRRVERTQRLLSEALLSLIRERGYEALSVQDIIDRANVGRATFYAHFDNKEDLLVSRLDGLRSTLQARQRQAVLSASRPEDRMFATAVSYSCMLMTTAASFGRWSASGAGRLCSRSSTRCSSVREDVARGVADGQRPVRVTDFARRASAFLR